jgi:hypothetical protein
VISNVAAQRENSSARTTRRNISEQLISESQIILHTRGLMPCWRIVFSTISRMYEFLHSQGQTRSFGDVGSMSGLPESGNGWAIYEVRALAVSSLDSYLGHHLQQSIGSD